MVGHAFIRWSTRPAASCKEKQLRKVSIKDAEALLAVFNGKYVRESAFGKTGKVVLEEMRANGIVDIKRENARTRSITLKNAQAFQNYVTKELGANTLGSYIEAMQLENPTRSDLTDLGEDDKLRSINPKSGMHINSPDTLEVIINGQTIRLDFPTGCALFVGKNSCMELAPDILIVGVENFENLTLSLKERALFPIDKKIVFIERGPVLQQFLLNVPNQYMHFGDFDLPGIAIYQNEFAPITKDRGRFFIPLDIEILLENGSSVLHETHLAKYGTLKGVDPELEALIALIKKKKKRLAQEYFLDSTVVEMCFK